MTTSTFATFGGDLPDVCTDGTKQTPQSTYGVTKVLLKLLVNDYTRRGLIDGRTARLATVIIRPGAANLAASSVASAIFREPLAGRDYEVPVAPETRMAVAGIRAVVEGLVALHEADPGAARRRPRDELPEYGPHRSRRWPTHCAAWPRTGRSGRSPGIPTRASSALVSTWPAVVDASNALAIGVPPADPLERIVRDAAAEIAPPSVPLWRGWAESRRPSVLAARLREIGVVPVVELPRTEDAVPLAGALVAGGLSCVEITLRTPARGARARGDPRGLSRDPPRRRHRARRRSRWTLRSSRAPTSPSRPGRTRRSSRRA